MKRVIVCIVLCGLVSVASASYIETFDSGSANWNYGYGTNFVIGTTTWNAAGGNPGAFISGASSNLYAVWTYVTAPYGDMTGLTMTIDTKITDAETGTAQFYVGRGGTYFIDGVWNISNDTAWTTHTVVLNAAHFTPWTGLNNNLFTLEQVLQQPDDIGIFFGGSVAAGSGALQVDNFGTVPEPATICLLGLGVLALLKKRKA